MHIISIIIISGLTYTAARFGLSLIKELAEIANEAWQSGDSE
ncbi:MAG: hypothetical protein RL563_2386 [Pseudomonadota bacterium]|jgi:hypothetical protein